jgi:hypothetical protein
MARYGLIVLSILPLWLAASITPAHADHVDGMTLSITPDATPGSVRLDWTGGQPTFSVYRSAQKSLIVDPSTLIGTTDARTNPPGCAPESLRVDFSHSTLPNLRESNLNELTGIGEQTSPYDRDTTWFFSGFGPTRVPVYGPVDFNLDQLFTSSVGPLDLNNTLVIEDLHSYDDWSNLKFRYQCSPGMAD